MDGCSKLGVVEGPVVVFRAIGLVVMQIANEAPDGQEEALLSI